MTSTLSRLTSRGFLFLLFLLAILTANAQEPIFSDEAIHHPVVAQNGMVASQHPLATQAGLDILKQGGNAVDAAVAVGFALAVVLPRAGNLGGGGFMLVYDASEKSAKAINYRETAPAAAQRDMYLDNDGTVNQEWLNSHYKSAGVPGTVYGLNMALEKYGSMSLEQVIQPAIRLARDGFPVTQNLATVLRALDVRLKKWPETARIFFGPDGSDYEMGEILVQEDLAKSLELIAANGPEAFYMGEIAERIADDMAANDGIITRQDLAMYKAYETDVVSGSYGEYSIASMPPPSSGGVHLLQMLNILEGFDLKFSGPNSAVTIHLMAEAMKRAYADRSKYLGDPLFWNVPVERILSKKYARSLRDSISIDEMRPSEKIKPGNPLGFESEETTHFSVVDSEGNAVSNTYTLNFSFGSGVVVKGTGILLNNEMSDFAAKPGSPDAYGLIGGEANAILPGKRPLSSMTPTIVFKDGKPFLVTGSPGGSLIITSVLQVVLNVLAHDMNVAEASHAPRIHHQWYPDILYVEKSLGYDTRRLLETMGYEVRIRNAMGSTQSIMIVDGYLYGASDPRRPDATTMGY